MQELLSGMKDQIAPFFRENNVNTDKMGEVLNLSSKSIGKEMMDGVSSGKMDEVLSLFRDQSATSSSNPLVSNIIQTLTSQLNSKLNIDPTQAGSLAQSIVPRIIDFLGEKFRNSGMSDDAGGLAQFMGFDAGNIIEKAKNLLGGKLGGLFGK